jgi:hypothetical protein
VVNYRPEGALEGGRGKSTPGIAISALLANIPERKGLLNSLHG